MDRFIISSLLPPPISSGCCCSTSLSHPLPTSFPGTERHPPERRSHMPPAIPRLSSLYPVPHSCVCRRIPRPLAAPFPPSACNQVPVIPWGLSRRGSLHIPYFLPPSLCDALLPGIFWVLVYLGVHFTRGRGARAPPLPVSC